MNLRLDRLARFSLLGVVCVLACNKDASKGADGGAEAGGSASSPGWTKGQPVDAAVLTKLGAAVSNCKILTGRSWGLASDCPELKTYQEARNTLPLINGGQLDNVVAPKFLTDPSPAVRVLGASAITSILGTDVASSDLLATAMGKESDPAVLGHMIRMASPAAAKNPKVAAAIVKAADHADKFVRWNAVATIGSPKIEGAAAKNMALAESDPDKDVREIACRNLGEFGDAAMPLLEKLTKDATNPYCFEGLVNQWAKYPFFATSSEKAYKLTLQRLAQKPRSATFPPTNGFSDIAYLGDPKSSAATEWKKKNTYFKSDAVVKALGDIVLDPAVGFMQKVSSIDTAVAHGATKKDLQAWRKANEKDISTVKHLDKAIEKAP